MKTYYDQLQDTKQLVEELRNKIRNCNHQFIDGESSVVEVSAKYHGKDEVIELPLWAKQDARKCIICGVEEKRQVIFPGRPERWFWDQ